MSKARQIIFLLSVVVLFLSVAGLATENYLISIPAVVISATVAFVTVDKTNSIKLRW